MLCYESQYSSKAAFKNIFISCSCWVHYVKNQDLDIILREAELQKKQNAHTRQIFCAKVRNQRSG